MYRSCRFFKASLFLLLTFGRACWQIRQGFAPALLPPGTVLREQEIRGIRHYHLGTTYLAAVMCHLRGKPRNAPERAAFAQLSALAYFFDDLTDRVSPSEISALDPETFGQKKDTRGITLLLFQSICQTLSPERLHRFKRCAQLVFEAETQVPQTLNYSDILQLTALKGGYSVLLFRSVLENPVSDKEENALFQFGYLIQLSDDIFDLWHDHQKNLTTPATFLARQGKTADLRALFENQILTTVQAFRDSGYPQRQVGSSLAILCYLVSITRVCLRHYAHLAEIHGQLPFERRDLMVLDMDSWKNRMLAAKTLLCHVQ